MNHTPTPLFSSATLVAALATSPAAQIAEELTYFRSGGTAEQNCPVATDGTFVAVSSPSLEEVYVYDALGQYPPLQIDSPVLENDTEFGASLAISPATADRGAILVIGAPDEDVFGPSALDEGAVYVYELAWDAVANQASAALVQKLRPAADSTSRFGTSVDIDAAGLLVVGAPDTGINGFSAREFAYTYFVTATASTVTTLATIPNPTPASDGDEFGFSVAADGNWVLVGAPDHAGGQAPGTVYAYRQPIPPATPTIPTLITTVTPPATTPTYWHLGYDVDVTSVGTGSIAGTFVLGAPSRIDAPLLMQRGAVLVFDGDGGLRHELIADPPSVLHNERDWLGHAVCAEGDAATDRVLVAGMANTYTSTGAGSQGARFAWKIHAASTAAPRARDIGWALGRGHDIAIAARSTDVPGSVGPLPYPTLFASTGTLGANSSRFDLHWPAELGEDGCFPNQLNSTGEYGLAHVFGSPFLIDGDLELLARNLPVNEFGMFLVGQNDGYIDLDGGHGFLCFSDPIGRYDDEVAFSNASGFLSIPADVTAVPQPSGPVAIQPGDLWRWQCWYRDGSVTSATSARDVIFQ